MCPEPTVISFFCEKCGAAVVQTRLARYAGCPNYPTKLDTRGASDPVFKVRRLTLDKLKAEIRRIENGKRRSS